MKLQNQKNSFSLKNMTDKQLYQTCKTYGKKARAWIRKFEGLLQEVNRRKLYKRRGYASIHYFAKILAGMSEAKVERILQLSEKLKDKPALKEVFESGKAGYSKVAKVAYAATPETAKMWAEKVKKHSCLELDMLVQKEKESQNKSVYVDTFQPEKSTEWAKLQFEVPPEIEREFRTMKQCIEQESGEAMSYGEVLGKLLQGEKPKEQKEITIQVCPECVTRKAEQAAQKSEASRHVPLNTRRLVLARQEYRCARDKGYGKICTHPPVELHHIYGYALQKAHLPQNLEYLCKNHHAQEHAFSKHVQKYRREN